jgi:DTW domain-containing protein
MLSWPSPRRQICVRCRRPLRSCICRWISPVANEVEVLILQHPLEQDNAKGSARLLHLSLPNSRLVTGEIFDENALAHPSRRDILLYPDTAQEGAEVQPLSQSPHAIRPALDLALPLDPLQLRLVVLDGTWRKSRKILHLNAWLRRLPRLSLQGLPASHYRIRKAHGPDQLSTLEASCAALMLLEPAAEKFLPVLAGFDGFVSQQLGYREKKPETTTF